MIEKRDDGYVYVDDSSETDASLAPTWRAGSTGLTENVIIQEGGQCIRMPDTDHIVVRDRDSDELIPFAPMRSRLVTRKYISANGHYKAKDDGLYAWDKVTVGVPGGAKGTTIPTQLVDGRNMPISPTIIVDGEEVPNPDYRVEEYNLPAGIGHAVEGYDPNQGKVTRVEVVSGVPIDPMTEQPMEGGPVLDYELTIPEMHKYRWDFDFTAHGAYVHSGIIWYTQYMTRRTRVGDVHLSGSIEFWLHPGYIDTWESYSGRDFDPKDWFEFYGAYIPGSTVYEYCDMVVRMDISDSMNSVNDGLEEPELIGQFRAGRHVTNMKRSFPDIRYTADGSEKDSPDFIGLTSTDRRSMGLFLGTGVLGRYNRVSDFYGWKYQLKMGFYHTNGTYGWSGWTPWTKTVDGVSYEGQMGTVTYLGQVGKSDVMRMLAR